MEPRTYTLKEAVVTLNRSRTAAEASRLTRHIRHWTSMDLLKPAGAKHTGTGRSREYSAEEIRRAAVLVELAKWRVPMTVLADSFDYFADDFEEQWDLAVHDTAPVYLIMSWSNNLTVWNITVDQPGLLLLDDSSCRPQVPTPKNEFEIPASAIVINLSRLLRWLNF